MAAPSLGHYASLSFVVIGRGQKKERVTLLSRFKIRNPKFAIRNFVSCALCPEPYAYWLLTTDYLLLTPETFFYFLSLRRHYKDPVPFFWWGCFLVELATLCHNP
jgi:hypothetical protein